MSFSFLAPAGYSQSKPPCPVSIAATDAKYAPGQVWLYKHRSSEPNATLTILKVETLPKVGVIIHIRLDGIRLRNCSGGAEPNVIEHSPFTREALDRSTLSLLHTGDVPEFKSGYDHWLQHCGGVYTIAVAQMIEVDEKTFNAGSSCAL